MDSIDPSLITGGIGLAIAIGTFFIGRTTSAKGDGHDSGKKEARLEAVEMAVDILSKRYNEVHDNVSNLLSLRSDLSKVENEVNVLRTRSHEILNAIAKLDIKVELVLRGFKNKQDLQD